MPGLVVILVLRSSLESGCDSAQRLHLITPCLFGFAGRGVFERVFIMPLGGLRSVYQLIREFYGIGWAEVETLLWNTGSVFFD